MDFIFMLTQHDKTVPNCLEVLDNIGHIGISHIGFKDLGVDTDTLSTLTKRIKNTGAMSYMEVVSTTRKGVQTSIQTASKIGVDRVLGGQEIEFAMEVLKTTNVGYYPFPGRPTGHPTQLEGSPVDVKKDCIRIRAAGCPGVDLLAYRATQSDPLELVRAARAGLDTGYLIVAGSVDSPARIRELAEAGADAFTIGSAVFEGTFAPGNSSIVHQCQQILAVCEQLA
ncbi:MAG: hypothetical protein QNI91_06375 [Arenicellales bacterium]|nr:hypothetical protein [Arenicellales bacterium]